MQKRLSNQIKFISGDKTHSTQKQNNLELRFLLTTYRKSYMGFLRTHYGPPEIQDRDPASWILTPKCKNAIFSKPKQFTAIVFLDDL